jgi:hypothetical protein
VKEVAELLLRERREAVQQALNDVLLVAVGCALSVQIPSRTYCQSYSGQQNHLLCTHVFICLGCHEFVLLPAPCDSSCVAAGACRPAPRCSSSRTIALPPDHNRLSSSPWRTATNRLGRAGRGEAAGCPWRRTAMLGALHRVRPMDRAVGSVGRGVQGRAAPRHGAAAVPHPHGGANG